MFAASFAVPSKKRNGEKPKKLQLPMRREFVVGDVEELDSLLGRFAALFDYELDRRGELFWSYRRGDWWSQCWHADIRKWKTTLNIAAYRRDEQDYRVTCYLDIDAGWNSPDRSMRKKLDAELSELVVLVGGREEVRMANGE